MNDGPDTVRLRTLALVAALQRLDPQSPVLVRLGMATPGNSRRRSPVWFWSVFTVLVVLWTVVLVGATL